MAIQYEDYAWKVFAHSPQRALQFFGLDPEADLWRVRVDESREADADGNKCYEIYTRDKTDESTHAPA